MNLLSKDMPQITRFFASWRGWAIIVVIVLHVVGGICMLLGDPISLVLLTPAHLCITTFMLLSVHAEVSRKFFKTGFLVFMFGMFIEINGVHTGYIFGSYYYTSLLGPRILGVPIVIGTNWLLLSYCFASFIDRWLHDSKHYLKVALGAICMVLLDVLIEPFAVYYGLWVWEGRVLPSLANYVAWFFGGCVVINIWLRFWKDGRGQFSHDHKGGASSKYVVSKNNDIINITICCLLVFFVLSYVGVALYG